MVDLVYSIVSGVSVIVRNDVGGFQKPSYLGKVRSTTTYQVRTIPEKQFS